MTKKLRWKCRSCTPTKNEPDSRKPSYSSFFIHHSSLFKMARLTDADRERLKSEYPSVKLRTATVKDAKGEWQDYVFAPLDRAVVDMSSKEAKNSVVKSLEIEMVNSCVFGDKAAISTDDVVFMALMSNWAKIQVAPVVALGEL
jgi:hypothetical protein